MSGANAVAGAVTPRVVVMDAEPNRFWFGAWGNINLIVWFQGATMDAAHRLDRTNPERVHAHPEKITTVHIVSASSGPPEPDARVVLNDMHQRYGHTVGCAAIVIERSGLLGAAVRTAVASMMMMAPRHYRVKVFDAVEPAAPWLVEHHARSTGVQLTEQDMLTVLQNARVART